MAGRGGSAEHRGANHVQELPERGGVPLARAEKREARRHHAEGKGGQRPETQVFRTRRRTVQEAREPDGTHSGGNLQHGEGNLRDARL